MRHRALALSATLVLSVSVLEVRAEVILKTLENNPFSRPDIFRSKPPVQKQINRSVSAPEKLNFELTATMVSESTPMVVVDGKLLGIGEKIKGYELIAVTEGGAVFAHRGKKYSLTVAEEDDESRSDE